MTWDDTAKKVAIHAIGAVEASMDYGAVNPVDPISIGLFQWYGTRAAELLFTIQSGNPSSFSGVAASIIDAMSAHPQTDTWWNNRYVSASEIASLSPMLRQNVDIQSTMAGTDLETYRQAGESAGLDADTNTETAEFFVNMYNQGPRYAFQVLGQVGGDATLAEIYRACLNHPVLGIYKSRYQQVYDIIVAQDTTGVGDPGGNPPPTTPPPGGDPIGTGQPITPLAYVERRSDTLYARYRDGHTLALAPTGHGQWTPSKDVTLGGGPDPTPTPAPPGPVDPTTAAAVVQWMVDHVGLLDYSQGPCRITAGLPCGYSDCSGTVREAYRVGAGIIIGTWTGDEYLNGTMLGNTLDYAMSSNLEPGDLVFLKWPYNSGKVYDHVEMYVGPIGPNGEEVLSHGGPGKGPVWQQRSYDFSYATRLQVNRYL